MIDGGHIPSFPGQKGQSLDFFDSFDFSSGFGLKALLVQVSFPEDKTGIVDEFESDLGKIAGVSQVQTVMVRRTSR